MLPAKRAFHPSLYTNAIVSRFPSWMKINNPESVGFRFVDAIVGNELELFNSTLQTYKDYTSVVKAPIDALENIWFIEVPYNITDKVIFTEDNISINVVHDEQSFLTGLPTRINALPIIKPSGLDGHNIVGIEWLDAFPSGILLLKRDSSDIEPSSLLQYSIDTINNSINLIPFDGTSVGVGYIGLDHNGLSDNIEITSEWNLISQYPNDKGSGTSSYIDDTGVKIYNNRALNNPYGSGVYDLYDYELAQIPITGTLVIRDVFNLIDNKPTVIPATGINVYTYTFDTWSYKGFEATIPWEILPEEVKQIQIAADSSGIGPTGSITSMVSWSLLPSGGYIDDEVFPNNGTFKYIYGNGPLTSTIRISGGFSKYIAEYAYVIDSNITQLSAEPKEPYRYTASTDGDLFYTTDKEFEETIPFETSLSNYNSVRVDPYILRPGSIVTYSLKVNTQVKDTWKNAKTTDKTVHFYNHNIGYTDDLGIKDAI